MGFSEISYKIVMCFSAGALFSASAVAAPQPLAPLNLQGRYTVAWNGISIGRIILTSNEDGKTYSMSVDTKTSGIGSLFSKEKRVATATGRVTGGSYIPEKYDSRPQKDGEKGARHTTLIYDAAGNVKSRDQVPTDDPSYRPLVPPQELVGTVDTVTGGLALRKALYEAAEKKLSSVTVKTYDGSRLAEMTLTPLKTDTKVQIMDSYIPVVNTLVTRKPISGYTAKELKKFKAGDPEIHLYFSNDEKFWPVRATIDASFGQLSATLTSTN